MKILYEQFRQLNWLRKIDSGKKINKNKTTTFTAFFGNFQTFTEYNYLSVFA